MTTRDITTMTADEIKAELQRRRDEADKGVPKVIIQRERKLRPFVVKNGDPFDEWLESAESAIEGLSDIEAANFIWERLGEEAKLEVKVQGGAARAGGKAMLAALCAAYSDARSPTQILRQFYERRQCESETPMQYSHALVSLIDHCEKKLNVDADGRDRMLRNQFAENVRDPLLIWELRKHLEKTPDSTFLDVRKVATQWWGDARKNAKRSVTQAAGEHVAASPVDSCVQAPVEDSKFDRLLAAITENQNQTATLFEGMMTLIKGLTANQSNPGSTSQPQSEQPARQQYQEEPNNTDNRRCFKCQQVGHIARYCRANRRSDNQGNGQPLPPRR